MTVNLKPSKVKHDLSQSRLGHQIKQKKANKKALKNFNFLPLPVTAKC